MKKITKKQSKELKVLLKGFKMTKKEEKDFNKYCKQVEKETLYGLRNIED